MSNEITEIKHPVALADDEGKLDQLETELEEVKSNLQDLNEVGFKAVKKLANLAESANHPKVYESLAMLIKAVNETNKELTAALKSKQDLLLHPSKGNNEPVQPNPNTQNIFLTSTDAIDLIRRRRGATDSDLEE